MEKFIFLDIDGVLNSEDFFLKRQKDDESASMVSATLMTRLNRIVKETGAKVVISSSWGFNKDTINSLKAAGAEFEPIDGTDKLHYKFDWACRGNEIDHWLRYRSGVSSEDYWDDEIDYVILDDDTDMLLRQKDHFINTSFYEGLTEEQADEAIKILNRNN